jgi:hypothetical protein
MASYKMWPVYAVKNIKTFLRTLWTKKLENMRDACTRLSIPKFVCARINALMRLIVTINLVVILRSI